MHLKVKLDYLKKKKKKIVKLSSLIYFHELPN